MSGILQTLFLGAAAAVTSFFNLVTLLLNTTSTNGAQNNTFLDTSSIGNTVTRNGTPTQGTFTPFSQTGWSGYFDGASDYIQFTNSDFSVSTGDFTAEWFMFITSDKAQVGIMTASSNSNLTIGYGSGSANARQPYVEFGGAGVYIGTMSNYMNTWVHICVMRSSGTVYTFQNGTLLSSASKSASVGATTNMVIGTNAGDIAGQGVPGYLSNVRFATSAIYSTSGFTVPTSPLTQTSQSATNVKFLTFQSNRFLDSNGVNISASSPLAITTFNQVSIQAFSPFLPTTSYSTATVGGSGLFVRANSDILTLPNNSLLVGSSDFSLETWVYQFDRSGSMNFFGNQTDRATAGGSSWNITLTNSNGYIESTTWVGGTPYNLVTSFAPDLNAWNYIVWCRTGSTQSIFLNGTRVATSSAIGGGSVNNGSTTYPPAIGANGGSASDILNGYLSGFKIIIGSGGYDATQTTLTVPTAPPTNTTNTKLLVNFTNAGIYDSAAKNDLLTVGNAQVSTTQAKWGTTSLYCPATNGNYFVGAPNQPNLLFGTGNFTVEAWIYPTAFTNTATGLIGYGLSGGYVDWNLEISTSGAVLYIDNDGGRFTSSSNLSTNVWTHIAIARTNTAVTMYFNGTSVGSYGTINNISGSSTSARLYVGTGAQQPGSRQFIGYIDDPRITKGYAVYTANFTPPTAAFPTI